MDNITREDRKFCVFSLVVKKMHNQVWVEIYELVTMDEEARKRLVQLLEFCRAGRSQRQFARDLGVSLGSVQNWLSGDSFPSSEKLEKVAVVAGMSLEQLFVYLKGEEVTNLGEPKVAEDVLVQAKSLDKAQQVRLLKLLIDEIAGD